MYLSKLGGGQLQYVSIISDRPPKRPHVEFPSYMLGLLLKQALEREREFQVIYVVGIQIDIPSFTKPPNL